MLLNVIEDESTLVSVFAEDVLQIQFYSTPKQFVIEKSDFRYFLAVKQNIKLLAQSTETSLNLEFQKNSEYARLISFKLNYDALVASYSKKLEFMINNNLYILEVDEGKIEIDDDGNVLLSLIGISTNVLIYNFKNQSDFKTLTINTNNTNITDYSYMPEFSIATFDDSNFTISRQVRFGQPVISTVPSNITSTSNQDDVDFYNNGKGPISKTIYFRIICNKIIETLTSGDLSELKLKIYMPSGLDTVKAAEYVDMIFVSNDTTNNMSIYKAQYDFYIQGNFNGIDYVDGLMYFDVQVPLTVQSYMPIQFDFSL